MSAMIGQASVKLRGCTLRLRSTLLSEEMVDVCPRTSFAFLVTLEGDLIPKLRCSRVERGVRSFKILASNGMYDESGMPCAPAVGWTESRRLKDSSKMLGMNEIIRRQSSVSAL